MTEGTFSRLADRSAFTLVEILIVLVIIGILAAVVVPLFSSRNQEAIAVALMTNLDAIKKQIDYHHFVDSTGNYPATIEATWFVRGNLPRHPQNSFNVPEIQVAFRPGVRHPNNKFLRAGVAAAYWYNAAEGIIRARVADEGGESATLDFYNFVNQSDESSLGNYRRAKSGS